MSDVKNNVNTMNSMATGSSDRDALFDIDMQDAGEEPLLDGIELEGLDLFGENTTVYDHDGNGDAAEINISCEGVFDGDVPVLDEGMDDMVDVADVIVEDVGDEQLLDNEFATGISPILSDDSAEFDMGMDAQTPEVPEEPIFDDSAYGNGSDDGIEVVEDFDDMPPADVEVSPVSSEAPVVMPASSESPAVSPVSSESPAVPPVSGELPAAMSNSSEQAVFTPDSGEVPAVMVKSDVAPVISSDSEKTEFFHPKSGNYAICEPESSPLRPKSGITPIGGNVSSLRPKSGITPIGSAKQGLPPASAMRPASSLGNKKFPPMPLLSASAGPAASKLSAPMSAMKSAAPVGTAPSGQPNPFSPAAASSTASSASDSLLIAQLRTQVDQLKAESAATAALREELAELKVKLSDLDILREENESLRQIERAQKETIIHQMDDLEAARSEIEKLKAELAITIETAAPAPSGMLDDLSNRLKKSECRVQQLEAENENMREAWYIKHQKLTAMKDTLVKLLQDKDAFFKEEVVSMNDD